MFHIRRTEDQKMNWYDHVSGMDLSTGALPTKSSCVSNVGWHKKRWQDNLKEDLHMM
jgi:hypothetical protein